MTSSAFPAASAMLRGPQVTYAPDEETAGGGLPETGGLSLDDAVAFLDEHDDDDPAGDGAAAADAAAGDGQAGDPPNSEGETSPPDDTAGEAENPAGEGEEGAAADGAENPADAPLYWKPEAKAKWAGLDPELQAEILAQEGPREALIAKAKERSAEAEKEIAGVQRFAEELQSFLPQAVQTFRNRWGDNPDWVAYAAANGTEAMTLAKTQFEAERAQLQQVASAARQADETAHVAYVKAEAETLAQIAPDLADPKEGPARRSEVAKFLLDQKIPPQALKSISAVELSIARDAMLWRRAQTKSSPAPAPKPAAAARPALTRGAASAGAADPKARAAQGAKTRFMKSGSIDDAVALLNELE